MDVTQFEFVVECTPKRCTFLAYHVPSAACALSRADTASALVSSLNELCACMRDLLTRYATLTTHNKPQCTECCAIASCRLDSRSRPYDRFIIRYFFLRHSRGRSHEYVRRGESKVKVQHGHSLYNVVVMYDGGSTCPKGVIKYRVARKKRPELSHDVMQ